MFTTVRGTFRNGRIELNEDPGIAGEIEVMVTFLTEIAPDRVAVGAIMTTGMLSSGSQDRSTLEDFKAAEFNADRWDRE